MIEYGWRHVKCDMCQNKPAYIFIPPEIIDIRGYLNSRGWHIVNDNYVCYEHRGFDEITIETKDDYLYATFSKPTQGGR